MGFSAIGAAVLGGLSVGFTAGSLATIAVGVVTSAVVGAAIGGLAAAVTGGDIGKGMLFGAVGGVVTGGLAGGAIVNSMAPSATLAEVGHVGILEGGAQGSMAGVGSGSFQAMTPVAGEGATSAIFGGAINTAAPGLAGQAFDFLKGGLAPEPQQDWQKTEEFWREKWNQEQTALDKELAAKSSSSSGGHAPLPYQSTKAGFREQLEADRQALKLKGEQGQALQKQEYALANTNAAAEWDRGMQKLTDAAQVAAGSKYARGDAYKPILEAQSASGNLAPSRDESMGMLKGSA